VEKYKNLDGLRGVAALVVVLCHYSNAFLPSVHGRISPTHTAFDGLIASTPLHLFIGGEFAVSVFFVLSGFVLTQKFFRTKSHSIIISSAARRYFRLMFPVLASILVSFVLLSLGFMQLQYMNLAPASSDWAFAPNILQALYQGLYGVFFTEFNTYNPVLWTMQIELIGSFILFMFLALFGKLEKRWVFYIIFGLVLLKTNYLAFLLGMVLSDVWVNRPSIKLRINSATSSGLFVAGLALGAWYISPLFPPIYAGLTLPFMDTTETALFSHTIGALFLIVATLRLGWLTKILENKACQYLGRISFSMYLLHFIILGSVASYLFNHFFILHLGYLASVVAVSLVCIPITFIASSIFTTQVDNRSIAWSRMIGMWLISANTPKKSPAPQPSLASDGDTTTSAPLLVTSMAQD
jgi:peptidoglycan/LPS O-acetylase OafA/YrhL